MWFKVKGRNGLWAVRIMIEHDALQCVCLFVDNMTPGGCFLQLSRGGRGGSIGRASASRSNGFHDDRFESRPEHKHNVWEFFRVKINVLTRCRCAPLPCVYVRTHKNVRTLKILQAMSEFGGRLRKHENTAHRNKKHTPKRGSPVLMAPRFPRGKVARISHALHWDKEMI